MNVYPWKFEFLQPYCEDGDVHFVDTAIEADFVLTMNQSGSDAIEKVRMAREAATGAGKPFCYYTCEDPNSYRFTLPQAKIADYVFTSDGALIQQYRKDLGHERVYWLPLAASPKYHHPLPLADDAADFVFSGNFYEHQWDARRWGTETVILPLARAGYNIAIFSYQEPPYPELKPFWRGATSCRTVAEQYTHGKVVLGNNNQRSGMDGREHTWMTSMRTFEALACGKPFLAPWSEAYEKLGLMRNVHLEVSDSPEETLSLAKAHLGPSILLRCKLAEDGYNFVLSNHTYSHRMERIGRALKGEAKPEDWR